MPNIDSDLIRGNIDTIILKTMVDGDKYGLDIIKEVESRSNGTYELKQPTLYSCLKRLENQELISSYWLDSDIGGRRHYYKLTDKGRETLQKKQEEWSKSKFIIDNLLSNFNYDEYRLVKKDDYDRIIEGKKFTYEPKDDENENSQVAAEDAENEEIEDDTSLTQSENDENAEENEYEDSENDENNEYNVTSNYSSYQTEIETDDESDETDSDEVYNFDYDEDDVDESDTEDAENNSEEDLSEEDEDNEMVYIASTAEDDENDSYSPATTEKVDQTEQEYNILSRLRSQDNEEINTYVGDKNSYINHLNRTENVVQQNILDMEFENTEETVDNKIDEFSNAVDELNHFSMNGSDETEETQDEQEEQVTEPVISSQPEQEETAQTKTADSDFLSELDELEYDNNSSFFKSDDDVDYLPSNKQDETEETETNEYYNEEKVTTSPQHNEHDYYFSRIQEHEDDDEEEDDVSTANNIVEETSYESENENAEPEAQENNYSYFDSIISETASNYKTENTEYQEKSYEPFRPSYTGESYKKKLSDLSKYSKISLSQDEDESQEPQENVKDLNVLKQEFEKEGIKIREYKRSSGEFVERNYMLINKLNLIKSLILLFGYVFVLSALYIILNNTTMRNMQGFSISYFLYAFIPFGIYAIYYLVLYLINPYKKVPAKYAPRIMFLISVIVTVQLLLITYCVNLQLGFYSFTQAYYNHLFWIIPGIISFAPIFSNIIFVSLFYSKNFNV